MMGRFARKVRDDIAGSGRSNSQIGPDGTYFVGAWSGVVNSIFHTALEDGIVREGGFGYKTLGPVPIVSERKMVFVIPDAEPFRNAYVEFDRNEAADMVDFLAGAGLARIEQAKTKKYLARTNIRKGCTYGVSSDFPTINFKVR